MTHHPDKAREAARIAARFFVGAKAADVAIDAYLAASLPADEKIAEIRAALQDIEPGDWTIGLRSIHSRNGEQTIADHIPDTGTLRFLANSPRFVGDLLTIVTALSAEKQELAMQALSLSGELETLQSELTAARKALEEEREIVKWLERKPAEVHCDFKCGYGKHGNKDECHCGFADWEASRPSPQVKP